MSAHVSISILVPEYTNDPVAFTKRLAVRCIVNSRMQAQNARGKGSRAQRRIKRLGDALQAECEAATLEWSGSFRLTEADVDELAERYSEARTPHYHNLPIALNFHE